MEQMEQPEEACLSLCRGKFLELLKEGRWEYVRRVNASGAVMIVAVTEEGELLLVEEYRVPLHARTVGLPAGISGDEGEESSLQSARRELEAVLGDKKATFRPAKALNLADWFAQRDREADQKAASLFLCQELFSSFFQSFSNSSGFRNCSSDL